MGVLQEIKFMQILEAAQTPNFAFTSSYFYFVARGKLQGRKVRQELSVLGAGEEQGLP